MPQKKTQILTLTIIVMMFSVLFSISNIVVGNSEINADLNGVAWEPNRKIALAVGDRTSQDKYGTILKYNEQSNQWTKLSLVGNKREETNLNSVSFKSDGTALIVGDKGRVLKYNGNLEKLNQGLTYKDLKGVSWKSDGTIALIVGNKGTMLKYVGNTFSVLDSKTERNLKSVSWKDGFAIAVGDGGTVIKTNGTTTTKLNAGTNKNLKDISWTQDGKFGLIVGDNGVVIKYTAANDTLTLLNAPNKNYKGVAWISGNDAILVGIDGKIYKYSQSEGSFSSIDSNTSKKLNDVVYCYGYVIVVGNDRNIIKIITSPTSNIVIEGPNFGYEPTNVSGDVKFTLIATGGNGLKTYYKIDNGDWITYSEKFTIPPSSLEDHNITFYSKDDTLTETYNSVWVYMYNDTAPSTTLQIIGKSFDANPIYVLSTTKFKLTPIDMGGGVKELRYAIDSVWYSTTSSITFSLSDFVIPQYGNHTIKYYSVNSFNISEPEHTLDVFIDNVPPITTHNYDGNWKNTDFKVNLESVDSSGIFNIYYKINNGETKNINVDGQPLINKEGKNNTIEYLAEDNLGNKEQSKFLYNIKLDKTIPVLSITSFLLGEDKAEFPLDNTIGGIVGFKGSAYDVNLDKRYISWSSNGINWIKLNEFNSNIYNNILDYWDTSSLQNGRYYIKLSAIDKANNIAEFSMEVNVNNTRIAIRNEDIVLPVYKAIRGQTITITVYIRNIGANDTSWVNLTFYDTYKKNNILTDNWLGYVFIPEGINAGKTKKVLFRYTIPSASEHIIKVKVEAKHDTGIQLEQGTIVFNVVDTPNPTEASVSSFSINTILIFIIVLIITIIYYCKKKKIGIFLNNQ